jgi:hypothetical protein
MENYLPPKRAFNTVLPEIENFLWNRNLKSDLILFKENKQVGYLSKTESVK